MADSSRGGGDDFVVPYSLIDLRLGDDNDTEQHKAKRGKSLRMRSIRHYRHATSKYGAALESFTPLWFSICISAGGLGILLNGPFSYPARWLAICSSILYVVDLVTFVVFSILMIARWVIYPHVAVRRALSDPEELGAYAIIPVAIFTLAALTASQVSESSWGGHAFTLVAYVLWWIGTAWAFITTLVVYVVLFFTGHQSDRSMTPVIFIAPISLATAGTEAGFISIYGASVSARLAVPQIIVGYFGVGAALFVGLALYNIYFHHLLSVGWVPPAKRAGLFILVGPAGQLSTAFQLLGESANQYMRFSQYKPSAVDPPSMGTFWTSETARGIDGAGILFALLLLGFAYVWICLAFVGIFDAFFNHRKEMSYSLTWWAMVFPLVTFTTAWLELGSSMDSPTFRALTSAMTVFLVVTFFGNLGFTIRGLLNGSLIFGNKTQLEIEEEVEAKAQGKEV